MIEIWQYQDSEHEAYELQIHLEEQQNRNPLLLVPSYMIPEYDIIQKSILLRLKSIKIGITVAFASLENK